MPYQKNLKKLMMSCIVFSGTITASIVAFSPAAEAHHRYYQGEFQRVYPGVINRCHYLPRCRRRYRRDWRNARRVYNYNLFGYMYGLPTYDYGYYFRTRPGIDIQIRL